ncbi:MAG: hypothetical protein GY699_02635, partial [Desulfobacteraceae bacterium]|nr:hypothetical protein [Desulfobacteraceae bacterium]
MNVNCETCGKLFRIDTENIKGEKAKFTCSNCGSDTIITIPESQVPEIDSDIAFNGQTAQKTSSAHHKWLGLRPKMVFLFVVIPIILVVVSAIIHLKHMDTLSSVLTKESSTILEKIGQEIIADKARSVADQCGSYLRKNS